MDADAHTLVFEANSCANGLINLLSNMADAPLERVQPFELLMLLRPISDRLEAALVRLGTTEAKVVPIR